MEKKNRVCKICSRRFANGKAMGGHMRSHLAKLPLPPKPTVPSSSTAPLGPLPLQPSKSSPSLSPSSEVNHMQQPGSSNFHEFSNETDSAKNPTGRRSKRLRKLSSDMVVGSPSDSVSSVVLSADETLSTEDAARCLLMLSRDKWTRTSTRKLDKPEVYEFIIDGDEDLVADEYMDEANENDDDDELYFITNHGAKTHSKYKCETCNKVFKSHQALGGHKASHKNKQILRDEDGEEDKEARGEENNGGVAAGGGAVVGHKQKRVFECPFCDKVFQSGQALGGHKKVHFTYLTVPDKVDEVSNEFSNEYETTTSSSVAFQLFDLNQPAPEDEHE